MNLHRPDIAKIDAARRQPFPTFAAVFGDVNLRGGCSIEALVIGRVLTDFTESFSLESRVHNVQALGATIPAAANKFVSSEEKHLQRLHDHPPYFTICRLKLSPIPAVLDADSSDPGIFPEQGKVSA